MIQISWLIKMLKSNYRSHDLYMYLQFRNFIWGRYDRHKGVYLVILGQLNLIIFTTACHMLNIKIKIIGKLFYNYPSLSKIAISFSLRTFRNPLAWYSEYTLLLKSLYVFEYEDSSWHMSLCISKQTNNYTNNSSSNLSKKLLNLVHIPTPDLLTGGYLETHHNDQTLSSHNQLQYNCNISAATIISCSSDWLPASNQWLVSSQDQVYLTTESEEEQLWLIATLVCTSAIHTHTSVVYTLYYTTRIIINVLWCCQKDEIQI